MPRLPLIISYAQLHVELPTSGINTEESLPGMSRFFKQPTCKCCTRCCSSSAFALN